MSWTPFKSEQLAEVTYPCWWKTGSFAFSSDLASPCSPQHPHRLSGGHILGSLLLLLLLVLRDHWISFILKMQQHFYCLLFKNWFHKKEPNETLLSPLPNYCVRHISFCQGWIISHETEETLNVLCRVTVDHSSVYLTSKHCCSCFFIFRKDEM